VGDKCTRPTGLARYVPKMYLRKRSGAIVSRRLFFTRKPILLFLSLALLPVPGWSHSLIVPKQVPSSIYTLFPLLMLQRR